MRRVYLGYDYNIAPKFTASLVLANEQNLDAGGNNTTYLKYAFLKWADIFKGSNLIIGQQSTPSFATAYGTEPLWGYRSVERTIMDMHNNDASSDLGVSLVGKLWSQPKTSDTIKPAFVGYQLQVGNGASAKPETDIFKKVRATVFANMMNGKLTIGLYGDYNQSAYLHPLEKSVSTFKGYASYKTKKLSVGFEIFDQVLENGDYYTTAANPNKTYMNVNIMGWSVFLSGKMLPKLNYFARMDMYNPNTAFTSSNEYGALTKGIGANENTYYKQTFYTAGLDYTPNARVHFMPNVWIDQFDNQNSASTGKLKSDYDLVYRMTFYFLFNSSKSVSNNGMDN